MFLIELVRFNSLQTGRRIRSSYQFSVIGFRLKKKVVDNLTPLVTDDRQLTTDNHEHSVQTGRCIQRLEELTQALLVANEFQFPSNGKVYPKKMLLNGMCQDCLYCFNSLQTGRCIQSHGMLDDLLEITEEFQFPSNGKVYPKCKC